MDVRIYLYIHLFVRNIYCSEYEQFYVRTLDERMYTNTLLKNGIALSKTQCAHWCIITPGCQDFTFYLTDCKTYGVENNSQPVQNTGLFEKDDANFTATTLPSGVTFTFAIVHAITTPGKAHTECSKLGSRLLMINSVEKLEQIRAALAQVKDIPETGEPLNFYINEFDYWVDGFRLSYKADIDPRENWEFKNGETMPLDVWSPGYPDGTDHAQCAQLWYFAGYNLDDYSCYVALNYICEK